MGKYYIESILCPDGKFHKVVYDDPNRLLMKVNLEVGTVISQSLEAEPNYYLQKLKPSMRY